MRLHNFRGLFSLLFSIMLGGFGLYIGSKLPHASIFRDVATDAGFATRAMLGTGVVGVLLGIWLGPRVANIIIGMGHTLERMSTPEKVAMYSGMGLGMLISLPFYQFIVILPIPSPLRFGTCVLLSVILIYLGIVSMMSMKTELVSILGRGGSASDAEPEPESTTNCKILDTNVIIDGRIENVCRTGFIEGPLYIPGFVLEELQHIADSGDSLKRARGRRGLDILNSMQKEFPMVVRSWDKALDRSAQNDEVDTRLVKLAKALDGAIVTNDYNLNKVAALQGVQVLNVNELANSLKPVVLPGELMTVLVVKDGKEPNQGVGYLDDGTMIVVEDGRRFMGETLAVVVTSVLQTVAGKMIFARVRGEEDEAFDYGPPKDVRDWRGDGGGGAPAGGGGYTRRGPGKKIR